MGSLCSKSGTHTSEDVVQPLNPGRTTTGQTPSRDQGRARQGRPARQGHTLGGSEEAPADPRAAAAQAAEERLKAAKTRGVVSSNPNRGKLAAKLEASKSAPRVPEPREEERLVWE